MCFDIVWALISKSDFRGFGNYETCFFFFFLFSPEMCTLMYLSSLGQVKDGFRYESAWLSVFNRRSDWGGGKRERGAFLSY